MSHSTQALPPPSPLPLSKTPVPLPRVISDGAQEHSENRGDPAVSFWAVSTSQVARSSGEQVGEMALGSWVGARGAGPGQEQGSPVTLLVPVPQSWHPRAPFPASEKNKTIKESASSFYSTGASHLVSFMEIVSFRPEE